MLTDLWTMMRKEWKEYFLQFGGVSRALLNMLLLIGVLGIYMPLISGRAWLESWIPLYWIWMPILLVLSFSTDSIAGERERHTLETLLTSRLSDRAILFGKLAAAVSYCCGQMLVSLLLGAVTINIAFWNGQVAFYPMPVAVATMGLSLLGTTLVAGLGVLVSVRAKTVRQAYQTLSIPFMVIAILPSIVIMLLPAEWQARFFAMLFESDVSWLIALSVAVLLMCADAVVIAFAMSRFQRAKLLSE